MIDSSRLSFYGESGLERLAGATITVVGAGGGGSHIVQQLAHLSIGTLIVIDHDRLEGSNVNRVVGATYNDVGRQKTDVASTRFGGLGGRIIGIPARAEETISRYWIERSDLVFGAIDSYRTRLNIERICRAAVVPFIDIGLSIVMDGGGDVSGIGGQVAVSLPLGACLQCLDIVTEFRLAGDRLEYSPGPPEQQVVSMNGVLASQAVSEGLALLTGFALRFDVPVHLLYDGLKHELRPSRFIPEPPCPHYPIEDAGWRHVLPIKKV